MENNPQQKHQKPEAKQEEKPHWVSSTELKPILADISKLQQAVGELSLECKRLDKYQIKVEHLPSFGMLTPKQAELLMKLVRIGPQFRVAVHYQCGLSRSAFRSRLLGLIKAGVVVKLMAGMYAVKQSMREDAEQYARSKP